MHFLLTRSYIWLSFHHAYGSHLPIFSKSYKQTLPQLLFSPISAFLFFFSNCFPWFIILTYQNHIPAYIKKLSLLHSLTSPGKFSVKPQHESTICIHTFPPFWTFLPSLSPSHLSRLIRARVWVSLAIQQIPVSYLFYIVSMLVFPCVSPSPPHSPCPQVFSMSVFPLLPCK